MKVLVLEDEALVALDLADMIRELGFDVVGPFGSVGEALPFCETDQVDLGILDYNLGSGTSAPVADALAKSNVPFVFLTGYRPEALPSRFSGAGIIQKPLHEKALERAIAVSGIHAS